ncbi:unnamed protein product, partial [Closterium sp. Naga37s-1]
GPPGSACASQEGAARVRRGGPPAKPSQALAHHGNMTERRGMGVPWTGSVAPRGGASQRRTGVAWVNTNIQRAKGSTGRLSHGCVQWGGRSKAAQQPTEFSARHQACSALHWKGVSLRGPCHR